MPDYGLPIIILVVVAFAVGGLTYVFRPRLGFLVATRARRVVISLALIADQLLVGIILASIDFGTASKAGQFTAEDLATFWYLTPLSALGVALEVFVLISNDHAEDARVKLEQIRNSLDYQNLISRTFLRVVSLKRTRFKTVHDATELVAALKPAEQLAAMIVVCWELVNKLLDQSRGSGFKLRVAYFRLEGENDGMRLTLAHCYDGTSDQCVTPVTPEVAARLEFRHHEGCLAVAAAKKGTTYLLPDAAAADASSTSPFRFFSKNQKDYLKSVAALPIKTAGDPTPHSVLMIDTNAEGFFHDDLDVPLGQLVENLAHRLHLEEQLRHLPGVANV